MPYFLVTDFRGGLDVRKSPWTSEAGTLQVCVNGHITRGGEIEQRKEFTDLGSLIAGTFALAAAQEPGETTRTLMVFGSDAEPSGLPTGVVYQRLEHPDGTLAMEDVVAITLYEGKPYVVARFIDGSHWHYYDGELVTDWGAGVVRPAMTSNDDIAEHMRVLIDAHDDFTATRVDNQITVVGPIGDSYEIDSETENVAGGVDDQTITMTELEAAIPAVSAVAAFAEFAILSGSDDNGVANYIDSVKAEVDGVATELLSANVPFNTGPELTAFDLVVDINSGTDVHGYSAYSQYGRVFVIAPEDAGEDANGRILEVTAKGNIILYEGSFSIGGGTSSPGVNMVTSVKAAGLEILGANVDWTTSNDATAALVAAQIVAYASSPKYNAFAEGEIIFVSPEKVRSDNATTISLNAVSAGDVTFYTGGRPQVSEQYDDYDDYDFGGSDEGGLLR